MMETEILTDKSAPEQFPGAAWQHPMYGNGKTKGLAFGKRKARAEWMEKNHKKWLENFSWKVLAIHKLRCNVKSLAAEARLIRKEEQRASLIYSDALREHRIGVLRTEARYAQLALAFVRRQSYESVEATDKGVSVERLAKKILLAMPCGGKYTMEDAVIAWIQGVL